MLETLSALLGIWIIYMAIEYRRRKPNQIVIFEKNNDIKIRKSRYYPRHLSLAISGSAQSANLEMVTEAKGHLLLNVRIALSASASVENISQLIRAGGWDASCIKNAIEDLKVLIESSVKEFCSGHEIEEISAAKLTEHLSKKIPKEALDFGLNIVSLSTQAIEPQDKEIILALQQQEEARIKEQTEDARQRSRTSIAKAKAKADEQIILTEHALELKKLELRKKLEENEAKIAEKRVSDELHRKNMQLTFDKKEMELLKSNPELLMLSPQLARLAEASQQLPNAKTVVSLSQGNLPSGSQLIETIQDLLSAVFNNKSRSAKKETK
jgi:hypothetical protein